MSAEVWKPVVGYEGHYEVSDQGQVKSLPRKYTRGGLMSPALSKNNGYYFVNLSLNASCKTLAVHHLVAAAFFGARPEGAIIRHLDGNALNNTAANLRYGTPRENSLDTVAHGHHAGARKTECLRGHAYTEANTIISCRGNRSCRTCTNARSRAARASQWRAA